MIEIKEFTCPICGSHEFEQGDFTGICHGYIDNRSCSFRFKSNDTRYFKSTGKFIPSTIVGYKV